MIYLNELFIQLKRKFNERNLMNLLNFRLILLILRECAFSQVVSIVFPPKSLGQQTRNFFFPNYFGNNNVNC